MRNLGSNGHNFKLYNTCMHKGRIFGFVDSWSSLGVIELVLGDKVEMVQAEVRTNCQYWCGGCCSLGDNILVMALSRTSEFAALINVGEGRLDPETVRVTELTVKIEGEWNYYPCFFPLSKSRVLMHSKRQTGLWCCEIESRVISVKELPVKTRVARGFAGFPACLPDGKLIVVGSDPKSTDIVQMTNNNGIQFERIGSIPGLARSEPSSVLIADRFVVGFGGQGSIFLNDLWVFDVKTRRSSIVWEKGEWTQQRLPALAVSNETLCIISTEARAITFRNFSGLIDDDEIRDAFCDVFGLPRVPRYEPPPVDLNPPGWTIDLGHSLPCSSHDTLCYKGRILHFSSSGSEFLASEVILHGRHKNLVTVHTGVNCIGDSVGCCLLGDRILVMSGEGDAVSAALIVVDEGRMSEKTVHTTALTVTEGIRWNNGPYLCQVSENRALLYFNSSQMYYCDVKDDSLSLLSLDSRSPAKDGFSCLPIRLSDGKLLVAGSHSYSTSITLITCSEEIQLEKVGDIPGLERRETSMILLAERFVLGFGGYNNFYTDDVWLFDVQARKTSIVWEAEEWVKGGCSNVLFVRDGRLWILGKNVSALPLQVIADRIEDDGIRGAFCESLELSSTSKYVLPPPEDAQLFKSMMLNALLPITLYNTVQHRGRVLRFSLSGEELLVSEVVFYGRRAKIVSLCTEVSLIPGLLECCLLGDRILVMSGEGNNVSAALVAVDDGELSEEAVHIVPLSVRGKLEWSNASFLCQISENRVLRYFKNRRDMWYCDITATKVIVRKLETLVPITWRFKSAPICLPGGKLFVTKYRPQSAEITLISPVPKIQFEDVCSVPGVAREAIASILIGDRFVVGLGGWAGGFSGEIWVFDIQTRRTFSLARKGLPYLSRIRAFLAVRDNKIYVFGDENIGTVWCISLIAISRCLPDRKVRRLFCWQLQPPLVLLEGVSRQALRCIAPPRL